MFSWFIHIVSVFYFFLWLSNVKFYGYVAYIVFICSSVDGHGLFSTFWLLRIMHLCASFCVQSSFPLGKSGNAGSYATMFNCLRNCQVVLQVALSFCIPTSKNMKFVSLHLTNACDCLFDWSHSSGCKVVSYCALDLHLPND